MRSISASCFSSSARAVDDGLQSLLGCWEVIGGGVEDGPDHRHRDCHCPLSHNSQRTQLHTPHKEIALVHIAHSLLQVLVSLGVAESVDRHFLVAVFIIVRVVVERDGLCGRQVSYSECRNVNIAYH